MNQPTYLDGPTWYEQTERAETDTFPVQGQAFGFIWWKRVRCREFRCGNLSESPHCLNHSRTFQCPGILGIHTWLWVKTTDTDVRSCLPSWKVSWPGNPRKKTGFEWENHRTKWGDCLPWLMTRDTI